MDPVLKELLEQNLKLAQENNDMLRAMKRRSQWSLIGQIIFWGLFVIAPLIFAWGYIAPLMNAVNSGDASSFNMDDLQQIINQYQNQEGK